MPTIVNMLEAKTTLSKLVEALERGQESEFVIARNGRPAARLVALSQTDTEATSRRLGIAKGLFEVPEDIDGANDTLLKLFGLTRESAP